MTVTQPRTQAAETGLLDDLEAGRVRAATPDPRFADGWRIHPEVKSAILGLFVDRATMDWDAGRPSRRGPTLPAVRGASCPAARPSAAAPTSAMASS